MNCRMQLKHEDENHGLCILCAMRGGTESCKKSRDPQLIEASKTLIK